MTKKTKGRAGWNQRTASNTFFNNTYFTCITTRLKALIITMAVWGLIPISWADWNTDQEGKDNE